MLALQELQQQNYALAPIHGVEDRFHIGKGATGNPDRLTWRQRGEWLDPLCPFPELRDDFAIYRKSAFPKTHDAKNPTR